MNISFRLLMLAVVSIYGCTATGSFVSDALIAADLDLQIDSKKVRASGVWRPAEPGHGLEIHVWANRNAQDYQKNLDLEIQGAAIVCQALSMYDRVLEWDYIDVYFFNNYQRMTSTSRDVVGVIEVIMRRESLLMLRERKVPASEYPQYWRFMSGYKDQPNSKTLLSW